MSNPDDLIGQKWEEGSIEEEAADDLICGPGGFEFLTLVELRRIRIALESSINK